MKTIANLSGTPLSRTSGEGSSLLVTDNPTNNQNNREIKYIDPTNMILGTESNNIAISEGTVALKATSTTETPFILFLAPGGAIQLGGTSSDNFPASIISNSKVNTILRSKDIELSASNKTEITMSSSDIIIRHLSSNNNVTVSSSGTSIGGNLTAKVDDIPLYMSIPLYIYTGNSNTQFPDNGIDPNNSDMSKLPYLKYESNTWNLYVYDNNSWTSYPGIDVGYYSLKSVSSTVSIQGITNIGSELNSYCMVIFGCGKIAKAAQIVFCQCRLHYGAH